MSECKHGVSKFSSAGCYNCVLDDNAALREALRVKDEALKAAENNLGECACTSSGESYRKFMAEQEEVRAQIERALSTPAPAPQQPPVTCPHCDFSPSEIECASCGERFSLCPAPQKPADPVIDRGPRMKMTLEEAMTFATPGRVLPLDNEGNMSAQGVRAVICAIKILAAEVSRQCAPQKPEGER